jgi:hypothetical protein
MKKSALLPMLSLAMTAYAGQTNHLNLRQSAPVSEPKESSAWIVMPATNSMRFLRPEKSYGGVLPELQKRKLRFFKPSPVISKPEFQNVSINPVTGRAEGIVLMSVRLW